MPFPLLAAVYVFASPADWSAPDAAAALAAFEGEWGFVSSEPEDAWRATGLRDGAGVCGAENASRVGIREEADPDGAGELRLRIHPEQSLGSAVESLELDGASARLTATFLGDAQVYERSGPSLTVIHGSERLSFRRC
jgi:hypothetical protein